jgi:hypothetical protein
MRPAIASHLLVALEGGQHELLLDLEVAPLLVIGPELAEALEGIGERFVGRAAQAQRRLQGAMVVVAERHERRRALHRGLPVSGSA